MRIQILISSVVALWLVMASSATAQRLVVVDETNQPDALVFADSDVVGRVSERSFLVSDDTRRIVIAPSVPGSWSILPLEYSLVGLPDTVSISAVFPFYYSVRSTPPGASVTVGGNGETLGFTPIVFSRRFPIRDSLHIALDGRLPVSLFPRDALWNPIDLELEPSSVIDRSFVARPPKRTKRWVDVAAMSLVALGGAAAVHYKFKADRRYRVYERTGDPDLRPGIKRLDVKSGVAVGVMQTGVAIIVIRLVRR
ncbi:MAG: hypothetical protein HKN13_06500 [Rhodothermales bacterium]|nr:hypothetical protein [Rhodothermales bacterium]